MLRALFACAAESTQAGHRCVGCFVKTMTSYWRGSMSRCYTIGWPCHSSMMMGAERLQKHARGGELFSCQAFAADDVKDVQGVWVRLRGRGGGGVRIRSPPLRLATRPPPLPPPIPTRTSRHHVVAASLYSEHVGLKKVQQSA